MQTPRAILGGSFNPLHIGHLRLAVEVLEILPEHISRIDLIPCGNPPHKNAKGLLPFEIRASMAEKAASILNSVYVNRIEGSKIEPSYTYDTLSTYRLDFPDTPLYFIVGNEDFSNLHTWKNGTLLPTIADFLVVSRSEAGKEVFLQTIQRLWPEAVETAPLIAEGLSYALPQNGRMHYLSLPRLDISSTDIRKRWLNRKSIKFLVPDFVEDLLRKNSTAVQQCWSIGVKQ